MDSSNRDRLGSPGSCFSPPKFTKGRRSSAPAPSRRSGEKLRDAREGSPDCTAKGGEFESIIFGRGVFLKGKNFHSIVIVVPLHVSKSCQAIKKLTAYNHVLST
jgi:hypothetical protein